MAWGINRIPEAMRLRMEVEIKIPVVLKICRNTGDFFS